MFTLRLAAFSASFALLSAVGNARPDAPVAFTGGNSGNDYVVDCNNSFTPGSAVTSVQLDGSGSFDPDGTPVSFWWFEECPYGSFIDPFSPTPVYQMDMTGLCSRSCLMELRVISGGQTTKKFFRITVQDATAPVLISPGDVLGVWGDDTSLSAMGTATALDNCDAAPTVTLSEVILPQVGPGAPEKVIQRTWTAFDCAGLQSSTQQTITLLAPPGAQPERANLDFSPGECPNMFAPARTGTVDVLLLGSPSFKVKDVVLSSLRLTLMRSPGVSILPAGLMTKDLGSIAASSYGQCNSASLDGLKDLRLRFSRLQLSSTLGLGNRASGDVVEIAVFGKLKNGKLFCTRDIITIQ